MKKKYETLVLKFDRAFHTTGEALEEIGKLGYAPCDKSDLCREFNSLEEIQKKSGGEDMLIVALGTYIPDRPSGKCPVLRISKNDKSLTTRDLSLGFNCDCPKTFFLVKAQHGPEPDLVRHIVRKKLVKEFAE